MNAERLHAVVTLVVMDLKRTKCVAILEQLATALQNMAGQPQQPAHQAQASAARETLGNALADSEIDYCSETWKQVLEEIGIADYLGSAFLHRVEEILSKNAITPSTASSEIQKLLAILKDIVAKGEALLKAYSLFQIGTEGLAAGECEVGVLIPRAFVNNQLDKFGDEIGELNKVFLVFAELTTGSRPGFNVRTISTTDFSIFVDMEPAIAACIAVAVERIVALYRQLLEIRRLQNELEQQGLKKAELKGIKDHAENHMNNGIDALVEKLIADYGMNNDAGRKNELSIELRHTLKKVAGRIDRGFNLEVNMAPPVENPNSEAADDRATADAADQAKYLSQIAEAAPGLQFLKIGGTPILNLPGPKASETKHSTTTTSEKREVAAKKRKD